MKYYLADNQRYSLLQFFQDNANKYNNVSIATGYLDLEALCLIVPLINNYQSIKILIGQEPLIRRYKKDKVEDDFPALDLTDDLQQLEINPKYANTINDIKSLIKINKLQIKIYKKTFLHAKCYIFSKHTEQDKLEHAIGIIGSSNLTANGISSNKNIELNHIEHDERVVIYPDDKDKPNLIGHYAWFNELWSDGHAEEWAGSFSEILDLSPVGEKMFSPYEMYIKTLWEIYKEDIEITGEQVLDSKKKYQLHEFQLKNANSICKRLEKRKLAMLCDSVGLGKTITALEVIARYIKADKRVVVICPASLKSQWTDEIVKNDLDIRLSIISLQDENDLNEQKNFYKNAPVGLFVIDESHNLRTGSSSSRFERVRKWIRDNNNSHCLMLTATPINNSITDLLNQILVGSGGNANVLQIPTSDGRGMKNVVDIINSMKRSEGQYDELTPELMSKQRARLHPILKEFVVRRTRFGILKEQEVSLFEPKLEFPQEELQVRSYEFSHEITKQIVKRTTNVDYCGLEEDLSKIIKEIYLVKEVFNDDLNQNEQTIDDKLNLFMHPIDQMTNLNQRYSASYLNECSPLRLVYQIIQFLGFIPHRYMLYHNDFYGKEINNFKHKAVTPQHKALNMQKGRFGLLRVIFLKRLESSFYALSVSINHYRNTLHAFNQALSKGIIMSISNLRDIIEQYGDDYNADDVIDYNEIEDGFAISDFKIKHMQEDIIKELALLHILDIQLGILQNDNSKIKELAQLFTEIENNYTHLNSGKPKILVFSYFADSIQHLADNFKKYFTYNENECEFISAKNRKFIDNITKRFAPNGKEYQLTNNEQEIRYLFATDVLSEGQNLQDCAILINYDLHWNPVRMIQRNGRINRIGSKHKKVLIYNMHPNSQLEEYLKLVKRLEYKINLIKDTVGQDQKILNPNEVLNPIEFQDDIEVNKIQQLYSSNSNVRNEIFSQLENEEDYLTDDKFITDLRYFDAKYKNDDKYKQRIYNISKGKFGQLKCKEKRLLIFTQINDKDGNKLYNKFFTIIKDNKQGIDDLHALQLIQTDETNNIRQYSQLYKLYIQYLNKPCVQGFIDLLSGIRNGERDLDAGMQNKRRKFLKLLDDLSYEEKYIYLFEQAILYSNHSDYKEIERMVKDIIKSPSSISIEKLLNYCEETIKNINKNKSNTQLNMCEGILFYGTN